MPNLHFIHQMLVPLRAEASDAAEMVSQLMFGDLVEVLDHKSQWRRIRNQSDNYEGWLDEKMAQALPEDWLAGVSHWEYILSPYVPVMFRTGNEAHPLRLTYGSRVPILRDQLDAESVRLSWASCAFRIPRISLQAHHKPEGKNVVRVSQEYLGTPYLWGGRSLWGIDCSGLTQITHALCGIALPRDASQQVKEGREVAFSERQAGDLAFFENAQGRVHHVGIVLENEGIRHAHGHVHDDYINETGIYNKLTEQRTHELCCVKRFV